MAYIGKQPVVGNFVKLDAIVTSATATYNLLNGGTAYFPQTANNCIVSLNGVIQSPTSAYTISGSTIVFDSALTSSDSIDFILVLGDVLNIGTPSDGTVTAAKIVDGSITSSKLASGVGALTGSIVMYGSTTIPTGYLECNAQAVSRTTYADLFAVIGTTFGAGNGTTTFNVPELRDKFPVGRSGTKALASNAGSDTATLTTANLASHSHGVSGSNYTAAQVNTNSVQPRQSAYNFSVNVIDNTGSGTAFNTFPPYIALTFIIKT